MEARSVGAEEDDSEVFWEILPGEDGALQGQLMRQLVVLDADGKRRAVPFNLQWTPVVLREAIAAKGLQGGVLREVYLDEADLPNARKVLSEVFPGFKAEWFGRSGAGQSVRTIGVWNSLDASYFRALAKIGLHGALRLVPGLDGHSWQFDVLRRFIRYDERPSSSPVGRRATSLVSELGITVPEHGCHVFSFDAKEGQLFATLQCFASASLPETFTPPTWQVRLGRVSPAMPGDRLVYVAEYFSEPDESGHTGRLVKWDRVTRA